MGKKESVELNGLEKVTELLKVIFASGFIDEKPLSCFLIAPVSSGKTTAINQFKNNKSILITTDSTAYGILKEYGQQLERCELRHIVIPDLLNAMARKKSTQEQLILFINASSEDGIYPSHSYGMSVNKYISPFGWVLCLTTDGFKKRYKFLKEIGFISRFIVVEYNYNDEMLNKILYNIVDELNVKVPNIKLKSKKKKIKGDNKIFREIIPYSKILCRNDTNEILRTQKKLQVFLKSSAYLRGDDKVKKEDLERLKNLIELFN